MRGKRNKIIFIALVVIVLSYITVFAEDIFNNVFKICVNGKYADNDKTIIVNDTLYVPIRWLSNFLDYKVSWDEENKEVSIDQEPEYEYPQYKAVEVDGKYGYKDENGTIVIKPQYRWAADFSEGLGRVDFSYDVTGFINLKGETVIKYNEQSYYPYTDFKDGIAMVRHYLDGIKLKEGEMVTDRRFEEFFIDKSGNMLFGRTYNAAEEFSEGYAAVLKRGSLRPLPGESQGKWSYIDKSGKFVTDMEFEYAYSFKDGKAKVTKDGIKGTIDTDFNFYPD